MGSAATKKNAKSLSLQEIVVVLAMLAIIAIIVVPRYLDLSSSALSSAKQEANQAVHSAFVIAEAELKDHPTVKQLAQYVLDDSAVAKAGGVYLQVDKEDYLVPTFTDVLCQKVTISINDKVGCVGSDKTH